MERMTAVDEALTELQRTTMRRVLAEEEARRQHVVVYLSGAHAYGFPSPDSDLDLKAIHVARSAQLLGLVQPTTTFDRAEIIDDVEIDYTSNELGHALSGIVAGNGNFIERVLGRMTAQSSPWLADLVELAKRSLSRRVYRHYRGFAASQLRFLEQDPTAKKLLYVLRTATTGIHLLETGELEADLGRIMSQYGLADAQELIERKRAGERVGLAPEIVEQWRPRVQGLFERLDAGLPSSVLPEEPQNEPEILDWLLSVRRSHW